MILALGVEQIWISDFYVSGFQLPDFDISKMNGQEGTHMPGVREGYPGIRVVTWMRDKGRHQCWVESQYNAHSSPPAPYNHLMGPHTHPPDAGAGPYTPYLPRILHTPAPYGPYIPSPTNPACIPLGLHDDPVVKTRRMRCVRGTANHHIPPTHSRWWGPGPYQVWSTLPQLCSNMFRSRGISVFQP